MTIYLSWWKIIIMEKKLWLRKMFKFIQRFRGLNKLENTSVGNYLRYMSLRVPCEKHFLWITHLPLSTHPISKRHSAPEEKQKLFIGFLETAHGECTENGPNSPVLQCLNLGGILLLYLETVPTFIVIIRASFYFFSSSNAVPMKLIIIFPQLLYANKIVYYVTNITQQSDFNVRKCQNLKNEVKSILFWIWSVLWIFTLLYCCMYVLVFHT